MKINNKSWLNFLLLIAFLFAFNTCDLGSKLSGKYYLTEEMKGTLPYQGGETVIYKLNNSVLISVVALQRRNEVYEVPDGINTSKYHIEENEYLYLKNDSLEFYFKLLGKWNAYPEFWIQCSYINKGFNFSFRLPLSVVNSVFVDSVLINNQWIKNVYYEEFTYPGDDEPPFSTYVYYSKQYGVVKWKTRDGNIFEFVRME